MVRKVNNKLQVSPFLKWAGGKRWLVQRYMELFPRQFNRYIEPFLGSGAMFFAIQPQNAILSDLNPDLIESYSAIRSDWKRVVSCLSRHHGSHDSEYYYKVRDSKPRSVWSRAAKFIYLNRTCWNGLYRVNRNGKFNVPIGTKSSVVLPGDSFEEISDRLLNTSLMACDFEATIDQAQEGDFVFVDPPYVAQTPDGIFLKYNQAEFSWKDQVRLKESVLRAKARGAMVYITNTCHKSIRELYSNEFSFKTLHRSSVLAANSAYRLPYRELLISTESI